MIRVSLLELDKHRNETSFRYYVVNQNLFKEVGIEFKGQSHLRCSTSLIRHLSTLGWPVGKSLYKQRKIKKELSYA